MKSIVLFAAVSLATGALQSGPVPSFEALHARSQERQATVTSIASRFTETSVSSLLIDPVVTRGTLIAVKPGRVVMHYESADPRTVIVDGSRLIVHWPGRNQQETLNIAETQERVRRYFSSAAPSELRGYFDISVSRDSTVPGTFRIDMKPRRDQIKKALELLQIWVDEDTTLLARMRMAFPGGDSKDIRLEDVRVNVPIDERVFAVPPRVTR